MAGRLLILPLALAAALALPVLVAQGAGHAEAPAWPQAHGNLSNTRNVPSALNADTASEAEVLWRYATGGAVTGTPAFADGVVYFADWMGKVHALTAEDGAVVWVKENGAGVDSSVALDGERLYVGDMEGWLSARNRTTGDVVWKVQVDPVEGTHLYGSPVAHEGRVYTGVASMQTEVNWKGSQDFRGSVVAYDAASGARLWKTYMHREDGRGVSVWSTPAIDPELGLLYVGTGNAYEEPAGHLSDALVALRLGDGGIEWHFQATPNDTFDGRGGSGPDLDFGASPILFELDGRKVMGNGDKDGVFYVLDRRTGDLIWKNRVDYETPNTSPIVNEGFIGTAAYLDGRIYAPTTDRSMLHALDAATGKILWAKELNPKPPKYGMRMFGSATAADGVVIQGTGFGRVFILDAVTGDIHFNESVGGAVYGGVSLAGDRFFVPHAGEEMWEWTGGLVAYQVPSEPPVKFAPPENGGEDLPGDHPVPAAGWGAFTIAGAIALAWTGRRRGPRRP